MPVEFCPIHELRKKLLLPLNCEGCSGEIGEIGPKCSAGDEKISEITTKNQFVVANITGTHPVRVRVTEESPTIYVQTEVNYRKLAQPDFLSQLSAIDISSLFKK